MSIAKTNKQTNKNKQTKNKQTKNQKKENGENLLSKTSLTDFG